jgi:outer membrane protein W
MRIAIVTAALLATVGLSTPAHAEPTASGIEVGLRTGYAIPLGSAVGGGTNGSGDLSKAISGDVPIWVDAGYRFPNLYIGGFFQYGIGFVPSSASSTSGATCGQNGVSCSTSDIMLGVDAHYHFLPGGPIDPYVGLGVGYEILGLKASGGGQSASESVTGFQFVNLQVGADYKAMPNLGIGPFVMMSFGQYSGCSYSGAATAEGSCSIQQQAVHEWLTLGVRGAYDINLF